MHNGEPYETGRFTEMSHRLRGYSMRMTVSGGLAQPLQLEEVSYATVRAVAQSVIACVMIDALFIVLYLAT